MKRLLLSAFYDDLGLTVAGGMLVVLVTIAGAHAVAIVWSLCTS